MWFFIPTFVAKYRKQTRRRLKEGFVMEDCY